jgi:cholest-4-en-3-one 26-monooxygenase
MPDLKPLGDPDRLRSGWLNGIKHWQVDYTGVGEPAKSAQCPVAH